jgi:hypothetical protein
MSTLTNAQILQIIASLRTQANTLEASLGPVKPEVTAEPKGRKERSDKGKSRTKKPASDEEPPEDAEPKAKKESKARKPSAWQDFVKQEGGIKKASETKTTHPMAYQEFVEAWNEEHGVTATPAKKAPVAAAAPAPAPAAAVAPVKKVPVKKAPAPAAKPKKELPPLPASEDEEEADSGKYELVEIDETNYWLDDDMNMLFHDNDGEVGDFAHFYKDGKIVNHV